MVFKTYFTSNYLLLFFLSVFMTSCSRYHIPQQPEAYSNQMKIQEDTMTTIDKYDFSEDYEIMSRWRPE